MSFMWPWVLLAVCVPFLVYKLLPTSERTDTSQAVSWPFFEQLKKGLEKDPGQAGRLARWLFFGFWVCRIVAAARPVYWTEPLILSQQQRNLMLVLDVSGSMEEHDFSVNQQAFSRLDIVKYLTHDFLQKRQGDQVGMVLFGTRAYPYVPLTSDVQTAAQMLQEMSVGMAGDRTSIGDALVLALKNLQSAPTQSQIIILMSDGQANAGIVTPEKAAELAKEMGVKIYTIGIGAGEYALPSAFGLPAVAVAGALDEQTLQEIAQTTGGAYFRAKTTPDLAQIYQHIEKLEPIEQENLVVRLHKELFYIPCMLALLLCWLGCALKGASS